MFDNVDYETFGNFFLWLAQYEPQLRFFQDADGSYIIWLFVFNKTFTAGDFSSLIDQVSQYYRR